MIPIPKPLHIREMREADICAILKIQGDCYSDLFVESAESLLAKRTASPSTCFVAVDGSYTVGYLIGIPAVFLNPPPWNAAQCASPLSPDCLYLHDLAVASATRGSGAGRALVAAFLSRLEALGLAHATLVAVQNAAGYWSRHGFRAVQPSGPLLAKLSSYGEGARYMARVA